MKNRDVKIRPIEEEYVYNKFGFSPTVAYSHLCPTCKHTLNAGPCYQPKYCSECGQAISFEGIVFKPEIPLPYDYFDRAKGA